MSVTLQWQCASQARPLPSRASARHWIEAALVDLGEPVALLVRLVDCDEGRRLNREFRGVDRATNVLSFPYEALPGVPQRRRMLGDIVLCAPLTLAQATAQGKSPDAHFAHLLVHGVLHLLGFEHQVAEEAERMEALETKIITGLGYPDPYLSQD